MSDSPLFDATSFIAVASRAELDELTLAIRARREEIRLAATRAFAPGDRVRFDARDRGIVEGVFEGLARKNALVTSDAGAKWRVAPTLLERA